jgi:hypothetical protein
VFKIDHFIGRYFEISSDGSWVAGVTSIVGSLRSKSKTVPYTHLLRVMPCGEYTSTVARKSGIGTYMMAGTTRNSMSARVN